MKKGMYITVLLSSILLLGTPVCHAADWVKNNTDIPNKNVEANYYDSKSVKVRKKTLTWTEKTVLTDFGSQYYTKHLAEFPACQDHIF